LGYLATAVPRVTAAEPANAADGMLWRPQKQGDFMTSLAHLGWGCVLVLTGVGCALSRTGPGAVYGVVRDTGGEPKPHTRVWVPGTDMSVYADSLGRYSVESLPAGRVRLRAALIGYESSEHQSVVIQSGRATQLDFVLPPGRACDLDCDPLVVPMPADSGRGGQGSP
jgi:hypothetical protein